ncbi:hypothetical protein BpHYR1_021722 [Brachionus plicatilis]|uniref:Tse2 ADP-ribosyltransferase toxin domain-containing protein n=1 Tax=Brachionus plicatilis TaxID=10195 RepID=A0A3M7PYS4_BRAPC|nr:hypothetical protein BpHYR1_021722 [Brachionus plicatilis]
MNYQKLLGRYTKAFPITLFRFQSRSEVKLREFIRQQQKNLPSFDFRLMSDGLIHPMTTDQFIQPNGMSLRPAGNTLETLLKSFRGKYIYMVKEGTAIPDNLVLLHEHTDHYSLQTSIQCSEKDLNENLTRFLKENASLLSKEQCYSLIQETKNK